MNGRSQVGELVLALCLPKSLLQNTTSAACQSLGVRFFFSRIESGVLRNAHVRKSRTPRFIIVPAYIELYRIVLSVTSLSDYRSAWHCYFEFKHSTMLSPLDAMGTYVRFSYFWASPKRTRIERPISLWGIRVLWRQRGARCIYGRSSVLCRLWFFPVGSIAHRKIMMNVGSSTHMIRTNNVNRLFKDNNASVYVITNHCHFLV